MTVTLERTDAPPRSPEPDAPRPQRRRWRRARAFLLVLLLAGVPVGWSYGHALTYPGSASTSVRTVDWIRSHGGSGIVNDVEVWYYSRQEPPTHGRPTGPLPPVPNAAQGSIVAAARQAGTLPLLRPAVTPTMPGEGRWTPGPVGRNGVTASYTTWFRPDPKHPTLIAGLLWLDRRAVRFDLVAGTKEPGGQPWPGSAEIPPASRSRTVAAFNSGFLLRDSGGGFFQAGHHAGTLQRGAASMLIDKHGSVSLGEWGRDVHMSSSTYAVRQNLHLIVDRSQPVKGLVHNGHKLWGSRRSQLQWTWRSGIGIDAGGNLLYIAGNHFTLVSLAHALTQAGAVRAMQLDIHTPMVTANLFDLGRSDRRSAPVRLLPTMSRPADRYAAPDQRDFITATLR